MNRCIARLLLALIGISTFSAAQDLASRPAEIKPAAGKLPNSNATYQQLKNVALSGDSVDVSGLVLKRDIATFTFESGTMEFTAPVNGMVTGAVFTGRGKFTLSPESGSEGRMLAYLSNGPFEETFDTLVLRFTDGSDRELKKQGRPASAAKRVDLFEHVKKVLKDDLHFNLNGRILDDVLLGKGELFYAFVDGKKYGNKQIFSFDPYDQEEVTFFSYDDAKGGMWVSERRMNAVASTDSRDATKQFRIEHHSLDTRIEKNAKLFGDATSSYIVSKDVRVLDLSLFSKLRVESVTFEDGQPLDFIQEDEKGDPDFYVILPADKHPSDKFKIRVIYAGKDAVSNEGGGNYYPVARSTWYPTAGFGRYATYDMTFRIPKKMKTAATGALLSEADEGDWNVSTWKSEVPLSVAGFTLGRFKTQEVKLEKEQYTIMGYANQDQPDVISSLKHDAEGASDFMGSMSTVPLLKRNVAEAQAAMQIYTKAFGPVPYKRLSVTQQTACSFGQAWPGLIYLPICAFYDNTSRHVMGLDDDRGYWQVVGPHEVAHQWWGHLVGFESGRDQWMSEGFAEFSASLFVQQVYDKNKFLKFWQDELDLLTEKNRMGKRAIDVGPLSMGYRLSLEKTGTDVPRRLIYPKGAYILHMLQMMMFDRQTGDKRFHEMMQDFAQTYANRAATTEDFKSMVEKHMTQDMNFNGNGKMDWFFDSYVYGTALPSYHLEHSFSEAGPNKVRLHVKLTQSNVDDRFFMPVPLYLELANGTIAKLGSIGLAGNRTFEQDIDLPLAQRPKRAMVNYYYDVLSLNN